MDKAIFSYFGFLGFFLLGAIIGARGKSSKTFLWKASAEEWVFRKPFPFRVGVGLVCFSLLFLPPCFLAIGWFPFVVSLFICLFAVRKLMPVSGPDELHLNLTERTFHRVRGWRRSASEWRGAFADLRCVSLDAITGHVSTSYSVGLRSRRMGGSMKLGNFEAQGAARQFAEELVSRTGLPLVSSGKFPIVRSGSTRKRLRGLP